jgi:2-polyprenyl-3-methyl-5-hydroxy-6-metoxy-1,4-benzoquinol methylase
MHDEIQSREVVQTLDRALTDIADAKAYNAWLFDRILPQLGHLVLDAGAGVGTFSGFAADAGARVVAVEPELEFASFLRQRFANDSRVEVVEGTVASVERTDFESVICLNVLEHIEDDVETLRAFGDRLRPGGRVFLLVPAHPRLYGGYDRAAGHVRRYSRALLANNLHRAGFEIETLRYVNPVGALGWLVRMTPRNSSEWPSRSFSAFDRIVPLVRPLDRLKLPFGLSVWAVARRD